MASAPSVSIDSLSKDERILIVAALQLKAASVKRAMRASSPPFTALHESDLARFESLILRFR